MKWNMFRLKCVFPPGSYVTHSFVSHGQRGHELRHAFFVAKISKCLAIYEIMQMTLPLHFQVVHIADLPTTQTWF